MRVFKEIDGKVCVTTAFLAESFGVTSKTIADWAKKGCPKVTQGYWYMPDVIRWRDSTLFKRLDAADPNEGEMSLTQRKIYWETECRKAQTENQLFKNAVLRGDYLTKEEVQQGVSNFLAVFKRAVLSLPRKASIIAAQYLGNERARELEESMMEVTVNALRQWSAGELHPVLDSGGNADSPAAGEDDGIAVG